MIVEDGENPSLSRDEYPESHSLVAAMMGKSAGSEFPLNEGGILERTGTVIEIQDKRVYRSSEMMLGWTHS